MPLCALLLLTTSAAAEQNGDEFRLNARSRVAVDEDASHYRVETTEQTWDASKTAFVICDMWAEHWCKGATGRVAEMAPRMNEVVKAARERGALIIHCPSGGMEFYAETPMRKMAQQAPKIETKIPLQGWCKLDETHEAALPIDDSDGGCDCGKKCEGVVKRPQIDTIEIRDGDAITDSAEAYYLMRQRGITNVVIMGVHTNMCVLGRPFGIRQMVYQGQNVVLMRDLTDTMYNSRMKPYVNHFRGTDRVIAHIERHWCPTVTSADILGGTPHRFKDDPLSAEGTPVTLENAVDPGPNVKDEPYAEKFSLERAVRFLDSSTLHWQNKRKCFTCHTNYAYLYARPLVSADVDAHRQVRDFARQLVTERWPDKGPRWDAEVVATAAALAFNDAATTGNLQPETRTALDRMWTVQREDGGFDWLKCEWPPFESDDDYGAGLAALAVAAAPGGYAKTDAATKGLDGIRRYLTSNPPPTLHHRAMLLWASQSVDGILSNDDRDATVAELRKLQHADGGWSLPSLGNWEREDGSPQSAETSDGYGTGFVVYILRQAGIPADDPAIRRGIAWLKANQRESGRWFTRSLHKDSKHYITHAGTAFAVMALSTCEPASVTAQK